MSTEKESFYVIFVPIESSYVNDVFRIDYGKVGIIGKKKVLMALTELQNKNLDKKYISDLPSY